jgi:capsular exopolysaccharide synthesis family protein
MEFLQYIRLVRKWAWLIAVAAFVAGGAAFVTNAQRPDEYTSQATLIVGQVLVDASQTGSGLAQSASLVQTFAQVATTFEVLQGTVDVLGLNMTGDQLKRFVSTRSQEGTSLLYITVRYTDAFLAADIANEVARQVQLQSPGSITPEQQQQLDFAREQQRTLSEQILTSRAQLAQLDGQLAVAVTNSNQTEVERLSEQRNTLLAQINQATTSLAAFTSSITQLQSPSQISIIEAARVPTSAQRTSSVNAALLGALAGAALAFIIALIVEYLDDTVRTTEQAAQTLAVPVLGAIARFGKRDDGYQKRLVSSEKSMSGIAEGYRSMRTNLLFTSKSTRKPVFVFTSANPEEGKSLTCANLAITMAQAGLQVVLIDADLRRPKVHEIFELDNQVGLTSLLFADPLHQSAQVSEDTQMPMNLRQCLQSTPIPRLRVITSGFLPSNPSEILGSALMERWIDQMRSSTNIDVIIIDTPPCLLFADSAVLAATAKAEVVLVVDAGHTRRDSALQAKEEFAKLGLEVKGVIVNRINPRDERGKYNQNYTYNYYYYTPREQAKGRKKGANGAANSKQDTTPLQPPVNAGTGK